MPENTAGRSSAFDPRSGVAKWLTPVRALIVFSDPRPAGNPVQATWRRTLCLLLVLTGTCLGTLLLALLVGSAPLPISEIWSALGDETDSVTGSILWRLRFPRALSALAVGGLLGVAGTLIQVLLRNPLGDPYVLGVSGGAASAALLAMLGGLSGIWITGSATLGALLSTVLVFSLSRRGDDWAPTRLLLTGVIVAAGWGALISFLLSVSPAARIPGMLFWLMGDLSDAATPAVPLLLLALTLGAAVLIARPLNLLGQGEIQAAALGVEVLPLRTTVLLLASTATAAAVTIGGSIGFVGLVVPHMIRLVAGSDHRIVLPGAALLGGALLLLADTLARTLLSPQQLPVGVITALLGVPVFLYLLNRSTIGAR